MPKQFGQSPIAARQQIGQGEAQVFRPSVMDTSAIQNRVAQQEALAAKQAKAAADEAAKRDKAANIELKDDLGIYTEVAQQAVNDFRQWAEEHKNDPDYWNQLNRKKNELLPAIAGFKYTTDLSKEAMKNPDKYEGVDVMAEVYNTENFGGFGDIGEAMADVRDRTGKFQVRKFIDIPEGLLGSMGNITGTGDKVTVVDPVTGEEKTTDQNYITAGDKNRFRVNSFAEAERQLAQNPRGTDSWEGALLKQARERAAQFSDDPDEQKELTRKWFNNQIDDYWAYMEHVDKAQKPEGKKGGLNFNFLGGGGYSFGGHQYTYTPDPTGGASINMAKVDEKGDPVYMTIGMDLDKLRDEIRKVKGSKYETVTDDDGNEVEKEVLIKDPKVLPIGFEQDKDGKWYMKFRGATKSGFIQLDSPDTYDIFKIEFDPNDKSKESVARDFKNEYGFDLNEYLNQPEIKKLAGQNSDPLGMRDQNN